MTLWFDFCFLVQTSYANNLKLHFYTFSNLHSINNGMTKTARKMVISMREKDVRIGSVTPLIVGDGERIGILQGPLP